MQTDEYLLEIGNDQLFADVDYEESNVCPRVLSLHGGGQSSRKTTKYLSSVFVELGKSVVSFDFTGHGDSKGNLKEQSLKKRHNQAKSVISNFNMKNITLIGSSMGGYIATSLLDHVDVENLILFCPAAYSHEAWNIEFGNGFTDVIRKENSFVNSDLIDISKNFKGNVLHIIGDDDTIIPEEVTDMYRKAFKNSKETKFIKIPGCPHPIHRWILDKDILRRNLIEEVRKFMTGTCT